jgi:hypothetical protein
LDLCLFRSRAKLTLNADSVLPGQWGTEFDEFDAGHMRLSSEETIKKPFAFRPSIPGLRRPPSCFIVEQVGEADTQRLCNVLDVAPCVSLQKPFALAMSNAERILLV